MEKVAIAGSSGLVGQALIPVLESAGHAVVPLRRPYAASSLAGATAIINLAGENLSAGRWTADRKKRILESRIRVLADLRELASKGQTSIKTLISASAIGYYGSTTSDQIFTESDPPGRDFLADVCRAWEDEALKFEALGIRVVRVRIGVVLSEKGGALPKMMMPLKFGISTPLGSGRQWIPWIRIDDLARTFLHLLEHPELSGPFNAVAPNPLTNSQFMQQLAKKHHRLYIPIGVPGFLLKAALGEMSIITLEGSRVSSAKLIESGFEFTTPQI